MDRKNGASATAVTDAPSGRTSNIDPQHDPLRLLCADPTTVQAARRLADSINGSPERIAAILLIMRGRIEAQK